MVGRGLQFFFPTFHTNSFCSGNFLNLSGKAFRDLRLFRKVSSTGNFLEFHFSLFRNFYFLANFRGKYVYIAYLPISKLCIIGISACSRVFFRNMVSEILSGTCSEIPFSKDSEKFPNKMDDWGHSKTFIKI